LTGTLVSNIKTRDERDKITIGAKANYPKHDAVFITTVCLHSLQYEHEQESGP